MSSATVTPSLVIFGRAPTLVQARHCGREGQACSYGSRQLRHTRQEAADVPHLQTPFVLPRQVSSCKVIRRIGPCRRSSRSQCHIHNCDFAYSKPNWQSRYELRSSSSGVPMSRHWFEPNQDFSATESHGRCVHTANGNDCQFAPRFRPSRSTARASSQLENSRRGGPRIELSQRQRRASMACYGVKSSAPFSPLTKAASRSAARSRSSSEIVSTALCM